MCARELSDEQAYHEHNDDKKQNWNDDIDNVVERFSIQIDGELHAGEIDLVICA